MRAKRYFGEEYSCHPPMPMTRLLGPQYMRQPHVMAVSHLKVLAMRRLEEVGYSVPLHRLRTQQGHHVDALARAGMLEEGMIIVMPNNPVSGSPIVRTWAADTALVVGEFVRVDHERRYDVWGSFTHEWVTLDADGPACARQCAHCALGSTRASEQDPWTYSTSLHTWTPEWQPICMPIPSPLSL